MSNIILDNRMKKIADCVPKGSVVADIGTDHGKLPIFLVQTGRVERAVAADINEMPLQKAINNIKKYGLEEKIDTYLTNGLIGIERFSPDCVIIAGMGGELIEQILEEGTIDQRGVKFVLQPMTKESRLRKYLCENGFLITDEHIVKDRKIYQIICAKKTGENTYPSEAELLLGKVNIEKKQELFGEFIDKMIDMVQERHEGKKRAELDVRDEEECLSELLKIKENYDNDRK